jgi:cell wall-associated NlpC family hydrolase
MQIHASVPNHGAVLLEDGKILHHVIGRLSCRDIYGDYWRRVTVHVIRHKELA